MTDQLILAVVALLALLAILFEAEETWRWRGSENRPEPRFRVVRLFRRIVGGVLAIFTLRRSAGRHTSKSDPAPMASEDVARRLGLSDAAGPVHIAPQRIVVSGPRRVEAVPPGVPAVVPPLAAERSSRLRLLRDTVGATLVLVGFVVVAVNVVIPPQSPTPSPSAQVLDATATPRIETPSPTESPSASLVAIASTVPEPSPTQTILVSSTPSPAPTPTDRPTPRKTQAPPAPAITPLPTQAPTATPRPTKKPAPKPTKTPTPAAVISSFGADNLSPAAGTTVTFSFSFKNATSFTLDYSDGSSDSGPLSGSGPRTLPHDFIDPGSYTVVLSLNGPGGDSAPKYITINVQ